MSESRHPHHDRPLFVVGSGRSGTTLLYHMLLVSGVFPVYLAETRVLPARYRYGPLSDPGARERFVSDFLASRQFARSGLSADQVREAAREADDYLDFLAAFMDRIALAEGKARWAEKTPGHARELGALARRFPSGRFIHIVRDGRDVALSIRKLGWTPGFAGASFLQLLWAGKGWEDLVRKARREASAFPDRYLEVRYEDLVLEGAHTLRRVAEFGEVPLDPRAVRESELGSLGTPNTAFRGSSSAPEEAVYRWKRHPAQEEVRRLALAMRETLLRFGYEVPATDLGPAARASTRGLGSVVGVAVRLKQWLRANTPLGRWTTSSLEIGLD